MGTLNITHGVNTRGRQHTNGRCVISFQNYIICRLQQNECSSDGILTIYASILFSEIVGYTEMLCHYMIYVSWWRNSLVVCELYIHAM